MAKRMKKAAEPAPAAPVDDGSQVLGQIGEAPDGMPSGAPAEPTEGQSSDEASADDSPKAKKGKAGKKAKKGKAGKKDKKAKESKTDAVSDAGDALALKSPEVLQEIADLDTQIAAMGDPRAKLMKMKDQLSKLVDEHKSDETNYEKRIGILRDEMRNEQAVVATNGDTLMALKQRRDELAAE